MNATTKIDRWLADEALPRLRPGDRLDAVVHSEQDLDAEDDRDVLTVVCGLVRRDLVLCCYQVTARTEAEAIQLVARVRGAKRCENCGTAVIANISRLCRGCAAVPWVMRSATDAGSRAGAR